MTGAHDLRCASLTRAEGHAPLGTAGDHRGYLLVDWPLPRPSDIGDVPELAPVHEQGARLGVQVQPVAPPGAGLRLALDEARKHHDEPVLRDVRRVA